MIHILNDIDVFLKVGYAVGVVVGLHRLFYIEDLFVSGGSVDALTRGNKIVFQDFNLIHYNTEILNFT